MEAVKMNQLIKGKPVADAMTEKLISEVQNLKSNNIIPKLAIVRVGNNPSDLAYERGALKRTETIGIETQVMEYNEEITQDEFIAELKKINEDSSVNGILVFRPFPKHLNEDIIKYVIAPEKDVDCFSPSNVAKLMEGDKTGFPPCTPTAVIEILRHYNVDMNGKHAAVIGRSMVVGKPVSMLLLNENATVSICHSRTSNMQEITSQADILVVGVGRAKMVNADFVKEGAAIIDVGINVDEDGKMCGDVDTDDCISKASMITPVPGGVGAVTTSVLSKHVIKACKQQNNIK